MSAAVAQAFSQLIPAELAPVLGQLRMPWTARSWSMETGAHAVTRRGAAMEFFEHRSYVPGHDPRRIDWRASAKRERPVVRFGQREQPVPLYIFLDSHAGMAYGAGAPPERWRWAVGTAATLGFAALREGDPTAICLDHPVPASHKHAPVQHMAQQLATQRPQGESTLRRALQRWMALNAAPGRVVCISDWLDLSEPTLEHAEASSALFDTLASLGRRGHRVWGFELLHRDELEFEFLDPGRGHAEQDLRFVDPRQRLASRVARPAALRADYLQALDAHRAQLRAQAQRAGVHWASMRNDQAWSTQLLHALALPEGQR